MPTSLEQLVLMEKRGESKVTGYGVELSEDVRLLCRVLDKQVTAKIAQLQLDLAKHRTEHSHGFTPNKESTR